MNAYQFSENDSAEHKRLRFSLQAAGIGTWDIDLVQKNIYLDDRCKELYGFSQEDKIDYERFWQHIHPQDRSQVQEVFTKAMSPATDGKYSIEFRIIDSSNRPLHWLHCQGQAYFTRSQADGQVIAYRISGIAQDITEQVTTRQIRWDSEQYFRSLVQDTPVATMIFRGRSQIVETVNIPMLQIISKDASIIGKPFREVMPELEGQEFFDLLEKVYLTGKPVFRHETPAILLTDGILTTRYFDFIYKPLYDPAGEIYGIINVSVEVTDQMLIRQQIEEKKQLVEKSEILFRSLVENTPDVITRWDRQRRLIFANKAFETKTGVANSTLLGKTNLEMDQPIEIAEPYMKSLQRVLNSGQPIDHYNHFPSVKGNMHYYSRLVPEFGPDGSVQGVLAIARDITDLKKMEAILEERVQQRTQELLIANQDLQRSNDSLQQFAYVASHDLQEPLRKIQTFSSLLQQQYADKLEESGLDLLERMSSAGERMSKLVSDLLAYSQVSTRQPSFGIVSLHSIMNNVLTTLEQKISETKAQIELEELPKLKGDELQLTQLFQNLLSNAIKYTISNQIPVIRVTSQRIERSQLDPQVKPTGNALHFYQICVHDQGIGFDNQYKDLIFQVFQRLHGKQEFVGTGVGLSICKRVVENHGGTITADGMPGQGAIFCVYLPA
ncbi:PAS domain-containing protein [Cytophagaceae bacterium YF14B1]|uniref:histidine kinase n=1 Tax=Xanthocytophaga flava TaxID=3048013 RepID=A0AAE3QSB8_9BACT|nr:PAS domain-containing protein [Xanthocytophaga flavus]MDJ1482518.1 PAS domain-containing protein [Xanthocytophaga flavus]